MATDILFLNTTLTWNSSLFFSYSTKFLAHINKQNSYIQWFFLGVPKSKRQCTEQLSANIIKDKYAFKSGGELKKKKQRVCGTDPAFINTYPALSIESGNIFKVPLILRNSHHIFIK